MKRAVGADELTDAELRIFANAVDHGRAASPSGVMHSAPIRDETGRLCEVRFYEDGAGQRPLGVVRIAPDGTMLPLDLL